MIQATDIDPGLVIPPVAPDQFRTMASWIIDQYVTKNHGLGGFGTVFLNNAINWVADDTTSTQAIEAADWPSHAVFYTVTVTSNTNLDTNEPGYLDPATAGAIADGVQQKGNDERANTIFESGLNMMRGYSQHSHTWWGMKESGSSSAFNNNMMYACDAKLGVPSSADCSQLAYSGLGPPSDSLTISPGSGTKFLSFNTCTAAITTLKPITLTWAQVQATLSTLIDQCVTHPFLASQGGRAYAETVKRRNAREKRSTQSLSGLNALPLGVTITLLK
ncbi:hypothetical protein MMC14_008632 [Varicellaria rhodocarpa]|nr:hypothetical protein [Varicellaria rhodocarpa]